MKKLYKYHGSVEIMSSFGSTAQEITLYDIADDDKAPTRLSISGGLAKYIYEIEMTDAEERYISSDWYFDHNLYLVRVEVPSSNPHIPAKIIAQREPWDKSVAIFGPQEYIEVSKPEPMNQEQITAWCKWRMEQ